MKIKISSHIHALDEILSSTISESIKWKLITYVEKDLRMEGSHAAILGKQTLQKHCFKELDELIDNDQGFPVDTEGNERMKEALSVKIAALDEEIEQLEATQFRPCAGSDLAEMLNNIVAENPTIEGAQILSVKPSHKSVMLFGFLDNGILLSRRDAELMLAIFNDYRPKAIP